MRDCINFLLRESKSRLSNACLVRFKGTGRLSASKCDNVSSLPCVAKACSASNPVVVLYERVNKVLSNEITRFRADLLGIGRFGIFKIIMAYYIGGLPGVKNGGWTGGQGL